MIPFCTQKKVPFKCKLVSATFSSYLHDCAAECFFASSPYTRSSFHIRRCTVPKCNWPLGNIDDEMSDSMLEVSTESPIKEKKKVTNTRSYARFGEEHREIVNEIYFSTAKWRTQSDLYRLASDAFKKAGLPLMTIGSFERNLRTIMNGKGSMEDSAKARIYTLRHMRMLEEMILENPTIPRDRLFALINDRYRLTGLHEITNGSFRLKVSHIRRKHNLPDNRSRNAYRV